MCLQLPVYALSVSLTVTLLTLALDQAAVVIGESAQLQEAGIGSACLPAQAVSTPPIALCLRVEFSMQPLEVCSYNLCDNWCDNL